MKCHEVDYEIIGDDLQLVEVELDPGETVIAEAGAMNYMEEGIDFESKMGDGSEPEKGFFGKLFDAGKRVVTGESIFLTHFTHRGEGKKRVAFAAPYPGSIVPVNMAEVGESLICQKDSFLCAALGTKVSIHFNQKIGTGLFGGEGFILQKLEGDGMAFVHAGGTIVKKELRGERLRVDTGCLVAFTSGIEYGIERAGGLKSMMFGGEGLFLATLSGHGTVWLQSLPFSRLADRILANAPAAGGARTGEGSILGGLGDLMDGD
ncbi:MAG: TIGR00266 family protein [Myxococcales bacterium]|nr:TIGR00266 family protein [Myxococcales bacterium]